MPRSRAASSACPSRSAASRSWRATPNSGDLVTLLRSLGPGVLRFGGVTADKNVAWVDAQTPRPAWATAVIDEADLRGLAALAARSGWRVLLTVNFGHYEPQAAAREAAAAKAALGESLEGLEIGNEPNSYGHQGLREEPWTFLQYDSQVAAYRAAIEAAAPGIPIAGPDVSGSSAFETWGLGEVVNQPPALLTGHHYPLSCQGPPPPTIERLLSPRIRVLEALSLQRYLSIAQAGEIPFRLDEANTVSCGGVAGVSNTFAGALWAAAYVSQAMSLGDRRHQPPRQSDQLPRLHPPVRPHPAGDRNGGSWCRSPSGTRCCCCGA